SCRIEETISNDTLTDFQGGFDDFAHKLSPAGLEQKQFAFWSHARTLRRKLQKLANRFADRRTARFTGNQKRNPSRLETLGQHLHLGRFSAPFGTFECDKGQTYHDLTSAQRSPFSSSKSQYPSTRKAPITNPQRWRAKLVIGVWKFLVYWSLGFGAYEIILARETGAV